MSPGGLPRIFVLVAGLVSFVTFGCSGTLRDVAREVTPVVVAGAVEGLADPDTQRRMVDAIDEGRVKEASTRLSAAMLDGMLDTLEDPVRRARLEAIVKGLTVKAAGAAFDVMLARALDQKVQQRLGLAMRDAVTELVGVVAETVGARAGRSEEWTLAVGVAAREIARQATLGLQDALDDTRRDRASGEMGPGDGALLIAANSASATGDRILWTLGIGLAALAFGLGVTLVWAIRKNRLRRFELAERDGALALLTDAINSNATRPGAEELHATLETSMRARAGGEHLRKVLTDRQRTGAPSREVVACATEKDQEATRGR